MAKKCAGESATQAPSGDCSLCLMPLWHHGSAEHLPCGHAFHSECLDEYSEALNIERRHLKCPHCKATPAQLEAVADSLMPSAVPATPAQTVPATPAQTATKVIEVVDSQPGTSSASDPPTAEANLPDIAEETMMEDAGIVGVEETSSNGVAPTISPIACKVDYHAEIPPHQSHNFHPADVVGLGSGASSSSGPAAAPPASSLATVASPPASSLAIVASPTAEAVGCGGPGVCSGHCGGKCPCAPAPAGSLACAAPPAAGDEMGNVGNCHFCESAINANDGGKLFSRLPPKWICRVCKRVDQAVTRAFGSIQWIRDMPAANVKTFYQKAASMKPKDIRSMCEATVSWQDLLYRY